MADADRNNEHEFYGNIFSPIDPRFNQYSSISSQQYSEFGRPVDTLGKPGLGETYSFESWSSFTNSDDKENKDSIYYKEGRERHSSIVDGLLSEIYDRWQDHRHDSFDSDTFTECSSTSEFAHWRRHSVHLEIAGRQLRYLHKGILQDYGLKDLKKLLVEMSRHVSQMSTRLVRQLKRRERRMSKLQNNCDIVTAIIQASSPKRRIDTRMKFSVEPPGGGSAFEQWKDGMKAVARLPLGIPAEFRKKVWLSLAEHHIASMKIDWEKTVKFAFNERSNPDDNKLGLQIVKDLHRTGCSGFSGEDNEEERALLKRILLAYARWNKAVGYCQGFNMIAALLLDVMDRNESDALKVMIYLIDHVLPQGYFANNLRALSVDMAVFRDLLKVFPKLSRHLDYLQHAQDQTSGGCYEPPLTNVFTMQWFLTLFATCLPKSTVLRVWDSILLDGSEILLRTALVIWGKLSSRILTVSSADEFYTLMGDITQEMLEGNILDADTIIKSIYSIAPFPLPQLNELREKYTYNIRPFTPSSKKTSWPEGAALPSDEDDLEDEDLENITCFTGFIPTNVSSKHHKGLDGDQRTGSLPDISSLGPGAYGLGPADGSGVNNIPAYMERMTTDISALKKQYTKLRQRQNQAHIILTSASAKQQVAKVKPMMPHIETPIAMNHLFLNKQDFKGRNRFVAEGPRIANAYPVLEAKELSKQHRNVKIKTKQVRQEKESKSPVFQIKHSSETSCSASVDTVVEVHNDKVDECKVTGMTEVSENAVSNGLNNVDASANDENKNMTVQDELVQEAGDLQSVDGKALYIGTDSSNVCKFRHSPVKHRDSGLGNSFCSSVLSCSSTENSPQHSVLSKSAVNIQADEMGLEAIADHANGVKSVKEVLVDDDSEILDKGKAIDLKVLEHLNKNIETEFGLETAVNEVNDGFDDLKFKYQGKMEKVDCDIVKESGDVVTCKVVANNNERTGASGDNENKDMPTIIDKIKDEFSLEKHSENGFNAKNVETVDSLTEQVLYAENGNSCCVMSEKHTKELAGNAKENLCSDENRTDQHIRIDESKNSNTCKMRLSSSDNFPTKSVHLSDSSNSTIVSADDFEAVSEVFTTNSSASHASFQQYCINKKNLSSESSHGIESPCRKTQLPKKMFNPFPVKHINQNRARTGIKLGLYKPSTLQEYEKNLNKSQPVWGK